MKRRQFLNIGIAIPFLPITFSTSLKSNRHLHPLPETVTVIYGPRQTGKTTLMKSIAKSYHHKSLYQRTHVEFSRYTTLRNHYIQHGNPPCLALDDLRTGKIGLRYLIALSKEFQIPVIACLNRTTLYSQSSLIHYQASTVIRLDETGNLNVEKISI